VLMDSGAGSDAMAYSLRQQGVSVARANLYHGYHNERAISKSVLSAFARYRPDVVHVQCGSPRSAVVPRELAVNASIPLIVTENYVAADIEISEDVLQRVQQLYQASFAVIAVCDENRRLLRERFGLNTDQFPVIRYGVSLSHGLSPVAGSLNEFKAITVARLSQQKGIDVLIHAIAALPSGVRNRFQFTLVGSGEQETQLKHLAESLGVAECIKFAGWSFDVPALLRAHDIFILPSLAEGQPIALLEALAVGLPCIASAVSGIPEVLGEGMYGALVRPKDTVSLSAAIASFAENPTTLRKKAAAAQPYLKMNHDLEKNMGEIVGLWESAC